MATNKGPDHDGPPPKDSGLFGLDFASSEARVVVIPAPFEVTVSYRGGTARGPEAIRQASHQIDLFDLDVGDLENARVRLEAPDSEIVATNAELRPLAVNVIEALTAGTAPDAAELEAINAGCERVHAMLAATVADVLEDRKIPCVVGGDHSVAFGPIMAAVDHFKQEPHRDVEIGILQLDAHADLRDAYEGFTHSHASVFHNVLARAKDITLVQVGIRDLSEDEFNVATEDDRVHLVADRDLRPARMNGTISSVLADAVNLLPHHVWLSFDIDGLDPTLCPHTGTPVPGGLSFDECVQLLTAVVESGRTIVGMDLCEVAPGDVDAANGEWDATVGARLLAKMCGFAVQSHPSSTTTK